MKEIEELREEVKLLKAIIARLLATPTPTAPWPHPTPNPMIPCILPIRFDEWPYASTICASTIPNGMIITNTLPQ